MEGVDNVANDGFNLHEICGQGLANSYLCRNDLSEPTADDIFHWILFVNDAVADKGKPFENYNGPSIARVVKESGVDKETLIQHVMEECGVSKRTVYRWMEDGDGIKTATGNALKTMLAVFARRAETCQKAWWAIASVCLGCCESDEAAFSNIEFAKQKAISNLAFSLHGTALDSLYICAMAYKDSFKSRHSKQASAQDAVDRVDFKNSIWWAKQ